MIRVWAKVLEEKQNNKISHAIFHIPNGDEMNRYIVLFQSDTCVKRHWICPMNKYLVFQFYHHNCELSWENLLEKVWFFVRKSLISGKKNYITNSIFVAELWSGNMINTSLENYYTILNMWLKNFIQLCTLIIFESTTNTLLRLTTMSCDNVPIWKKI